MANDGALHRILMRFSPFGLALAATIAATISAPAFAAAPSIEIWHSNTVWANQGMCSASFTVDTGMPDEPIHGLKVQIAAIDAKGKTIAKDTLAFDDELGSSSATRYGGAFFESEAACDDTLRIQIISATATVAGKRQVIGMTARSFKPFRILVK